MELSLRTIYDSFPGAFPFPEFLPLSTRYSPYSHPNAQQRRADWHLDPQQRWRLVSAAQNVAHPSWLQVKSGGESGLVNERKSQLGNLILRLAKEISLSWVTALIMLELQLLEISVR